MSYETNAIAKRLKITKGWKNPHFPTKTLNYARDVIIWFKIYLLLKVYLSLHEIKLLTCEIRWSENHTKVLYLAVSKEFHKKKKAKSKRELKSVLRKLKSPFIEPRNKNARFFLYHDLQFLKKNSPLILNTWQKTILSKIWLSKPRFTSWINISLNTYRVRKKNTLQYKYSSLWKYRLQKPMSTNLQKQLLISLQHFPSKNRRALVSNKVYLHKQKQLLSFIVKTKKQLIFLKQSLQGLQLFQQQTNKIHSSRTSFLSSFQIEKLVCYLKTKIGTKQKILTKVLQLYKSLKIFNNVSYRNKFIYKRKRIARRKLISKSKRIKDKKRKKTRKFSQLQKRVVKKKLKAFWNQIKTQSFKIKIQSRILINSPQLVCFSKSNLYKKTHKHLTLLTEQLLLRNILFYTSVLYKTKTKKQLTWKLPLNFRRNKKYRTLYKKYKKNKKTRNTRRYLRKKVHKKKRFNKKLTTLTELPLNLRYRYLFKNILQHKPIFLPLIRLLEKGNRIYPSQVAKLTRLNQKRKRKIKKKYLWKAKGKSLQLVKKLKTLKKLKRQAKKRYLTFDLENKSKRKLLQYRRNYRQLYKNHLTLMTNLQLKYHIQDFIQKYFTLSTHVKLFWPLPDFKNLKFYRLIFAQRKKVDKKQSQSIFHSTKDINKEPNKTKIQTKSIKEPYLFIGKPTKHIIQFSTSNLRKKSSEISLSSFEHRKLRKKSAYLLAKNKALQKKSQNRLFWMAKISFVPNLISTLTLFAKYLDPQPLADHLAAIIGQTKRHSSVLKLLETALRMLHFKRGIGYRIALTGRINGATKTRTFYLAKLKRERPRQTFDKNVNFAMAQARATIGAFGIKIWVYS